MEGNSSRPTEEVLKKKEKKKEQNSKAAKKYYLKNRLKIIERNSEYSKKKYKEDLAFRQSIKDRSARHYLKNKAYKITYWRGDIA